MKTLTEIAWLAGLIEGEGSFIYKESDSPLISIQMTDEDVIRRVSVLFGTNVRGPYVRTDGHQTTWTCVVYGAKAVGWMLTLFTFMGERRKAKIRDVLTRWKSYVPPVRTNKLPGVPRKKKRMNATCHPDKLVIGWGLCGKCYMRQWRSTRMASIKEKP